MYYLSGTVQLTLGKELSAMGFNGIPVAMLAASHPIGTIFSALFISYIQVGGDSMQPPGTRCPPPPGRACAGSPGGA